MFNATSKSARRLRRYALLTAACVGAGTWSSHGYGQTAVTWDGATGPYTTATNWNPDVVPSNAANHFLTIGNGGTAQVGGVDAAEGTALNLGMLPGETGHLQVSGGTITLGELRVGGRETVPDPTFTTFTPNGGGTGTVVQSGGTVNVTYTPGSEPPVQSLYIGDGGLATGNTANGSYTITAGDLNSGIAADDAIVVGTGVGSQGTFVQQGGNVTSSGFVTVGRGGATSTYTMSGGTLNVGTGATATSQNLRIGDGEYPTGTFSNVTSGTFTLTSGTVTVKNDTTVGRNQGTGALNISGSGSTYNAENNINVGHGGTGTVVMGTTGGSGPTVNAGVVATGTKGMSVGISATATNPGSGTFTMRSGALNIGNGSADYLAIGDGAFGTGVFNLEGGTITTTDLVQLGRNNSPNDNRLNMSGGTIVAGRTIAGGGNGATNGRGTWTMTAGSVTGSLATNIAIGAAGGNTCVGMLDIQGGTWTLTGVAGTDAVMAVGNGVGAVGTLLISGGVVSVETSVGTVDVGRNGATGSFTLSGTGLLKANHLRMADLGAGSGTKTITFNGGSSVLTQLTLGNVGVMTINGGSHTIATTNFNTGSTFTTNIDQAITTANHGTSTINVGAGATLTIGAANTNSAPRTITKAGAGTMTINGAQNHFAGTTLSVAAGTVNENSDPAGQNVSSAATTNFNAPLSTVGTLSVTGGTTTVKQAANPSVATNVLVTSTVAVAGGKLDLKNNKLITTTLPGSSTGGVYDGVQGLVQTGLNGGGWDGNGIVTNEPAALTNLTTIGVSTGAAARGLGPADTDLFGGATINGASTLAMYTYAGDLNLDGVINADDYANIDFNANIAGADSYYNGDVNYDGTINADDYATIDFNNNAQGAPFATSGGIEGVTAVPEPASVGGLLMAAALGLRPRRRKAR